MNIQVNIQVRACIPGPAYQGRRKHTRACIPGPAYQGRRNRYGHCYGHYSFDLVMRMYKEGLMIFIIKITSVDAGASLGASLRELAAM